MPRNLDPALSAALATGRVVPFFAAALTFKSAIRYVCSAPFSITFGGNTYLGVGSLGTVAGINEGVEVKADGTSLTLSGIDPIYLGESLTDIQQGGQAILYIGFLSNTGTIVGTPYQLFKGVIDAPSVTVGGQTVSITLPLENKMVNGQRATMRRYTSADQRKFFPTDTAFTWVEQLNDLALIWGQ